MNVQIGKQGAGLGEERAAGSTKDLPAGGADRKQSGRGRVLDVLIIGSGFSGIGMAIKLQEEGMTDFLILEKTDGIGGTWYKNTYPGAACDVPSHFYCFSFAPNPDWSRIYSPQPEIQAYMERCADQYGITPRIRFNSPVDLITFDDDTALWTVELPDGAIYLARHVVIGSGGLNIPTVPDLPGLSDFERPAFHTAEWRHDLDLTGKEVVVIGSAASAVQVVPEIARYAKKVVMFQRTPNYILPRMDRAYTDAEKALFREKPWRLKLLRWKMFWRFEVVLTPLFKRRSWLRRRLADKTRAYIRRAIKDPDLQEKLTPDYEMGCKRILISDDFYGALNRENVTVVTDGIDRIERDGVVDRAGNWHRAEALVLATGYDLHAHMTSIEVRGQGGVSLQSLWRDAPQAYEGAMVHGFPNLYFVTGPNTGVGSTSVVFMIEAQIRLILKGLKKAGRTRLLHPRAEVVEAHNDTLQKDLEKTVWATDCKSWYKAASGRIHTLYPRSAGHFLKRKLRLRMGDFILESKSDDQIRAAEQKAGEYSLLEEKC
ncbi:flavin-containing monooxygenase [Sneathiella chinensis]|nr:NAD(P)/FAD-dependent oxidoreductase [Sneathiella chinensis]